MNLARIIHKPQSYRQKRVLNTNTILNELKHYDICISRPNCKSLITFSMSFIIWISISWYQDIDISYVKYMISICKSQVWDMRRRRQRGGPGGGRGPPPPVRPSSNVLNPLSTLSLKYSKVRLGKKSYQTILKFGLLAKPPQKPRKKKQLILEL